MTVQALGQAPFKDLKPTDLCPKCKFLVMDHEVEAVKAAKSVITVPTPVAVVPVAVPVGAPYTSFLCLGEVIVFPTDKIPDDCMLAGISRMSKPTAGGEYEIKGTTPEALKAVREALVCGAMVPRRYGDVVKYLSLTDKVRIGSEISGDVASRLSNMDTDDPSHFTGCSFELKTTVAEARSILVKAGLKMQAREGYDKLAGKLKWVGGKPPSGVSVSLYFKKRDAALCPEWFKNVIAEMCQNVECPQPEHVEYEETATDYKKSWTLHGFPRGNSPETLKALLEHAPTFETPPTFESI